MGRKAERRGEIDNAPARRSQMRKHRLRDQDRAQHIGVQNGADIRGVHSAQGTIRCDAGAVDQDIHVAKTRDGIGGDPQGRIAVSNVALHYQASSAGSYNFRGQAFGCVAAGLVADGYVAAGRGQAARNSGADAARTAGDQRYLATQ